MLRIKIGVAPTARWLRRRTTLFSLSLILLFAQAGGHTQGTLGSLTFRWNYFGNFDHVVGGVGLRGLGDASRYATGRIHVPDVPDTADIAAAFAYWASIDSTTELSAQNAIFRGNPIVGKQIAPAGVPACFGSGGPSTGQPGNFRAYFADVLRYLPTGPTGRVLVDDLDLTTNGLAAGHEMRVADNGAGGSQSPSSGNQLTYAEGASLLIVYRDKSKPFKAVVIYHGGQTVNSDQPSATITIEGFHDALVPKDSIGNPLPGSARITPIVADGDGPFQETLSFLNVNGNFVVTNPFSSSEGSAWDNPTYDVSSYIVDHQSSVSLRLNPVVGSVDCVNFVAAVFNTTLDDPDGDSIPSAVESSTSGVVDPDGRRQPPFGAMGFNPLVPDVMFEFNYLKARSGQTYGRPGFDQVTITEDHTHLLTAPALERAGRLFMNGGVIPHFDVGPNYQPSTTPSGCASPATWTLGCAIVPVGLAQGGQFRYEQDLNNDGVNEADYCNHEDPGIADCQFKYWPAIGWKSGYLYYRDALFGFASRNRTDFVHHVLGGHAFGVPVDPCLTLEGTPDLPCRQNANSGYHKPRTISGIGDLGGGDILMALWGFGNNYMGAVEHQAGTFAHEAGHNLELKHAGGLRRPNCITPYHSIMNYLYQFGFPGTTQIDFSDRVLKATLPGANALDENNLSDSALVVVPPGTGTAKFASRWYTRKDTSFIHNGTNGLNTAPATKHCNGTPISAGDPEMVRIDGRRATDKIDWLNDGDTIDVGLLSVDVNFNGGPKLSPATPTDGPFSGFNDWPIVKLYGLRQVGSRPNGGLFSLDVQFDDLDSADPGREDPGREDPGREDPGREDPGREDPGAPSGDLDFETAIGTFGGPTSLTGVSTQKAIRLSWSQPSLVPPDTFNIRYFLYRVTGTEVTLQNWGQKVSLGPTTLTTFDDSGAQNNKTYTYLVQGEVHFGNPENVKLTAISNFFTITKQP